MKGYCLWRKLSIMRPSKKVPTGHFSLVRCYSGGKVFSSSLKLHSSEMPQVQKDYQRPHPVVQYIMS